MLILPLVSLRFLGELHLPKKFASRVSLFSQLVHSSINSPWIHLRFLLDQFRVVYTHDLTLSVSPQLFKEQIGNESEMEQRMKWRYRIEWRDEKRMKPLLKEWISGWDYWLFLKGTVSEKLETERVEALKADLKKGNMVWEKVQVDGFPLSNRRRWKADAMDMIANKHQEDYDNKTFEVRSLSP